MRLLAFAIIICVVISCSDSKDKQKIEGHLVYTSRSFDSFESMRADTFFVGEKIVFGARSSSEGGKGEQFGCSKLIIGIYQMPSEKTLLTTERDVAPDWTGTRQDLGEELPYLEPGNYIVRFVKSPSNEIYAKGNFVVIKK